MDPWTPGPGDPWDPSYGTRGPVDPGTRGPGTRGPPGPAQEDRGWPVKILSGHLSFRWGIAVFKQEEGAG